VPWQSQPLYGQSVIAFLDDGGAVVSGITAMAEDRWPG